jgi:hypothetical protein
MNDTIHCRRCAVSLVLWVGAAAGFQSFAGSAGQQQGGSCESRKFRLE